VAFALFAIDPAGQYPWGWLALSGPLCMYWLLVYVSGIPPLEAHMISTYSEAYRSYQRRTSAFFPLPPRSR
jgi:steroid 5-alpha reductase family enzyme